MNKIENKKFLNRNWFWIIIIGFIAFFNLRLCKDDMSIEKNGVIVSVTVEYYDRKSFNRKMKTVSGGYYCVNNKRYKCFYKYEIPKGSTFKIKYNPRNPEVWRFIDE